ASRLVALDSQNGSEKWRTQSNRFWNQYMTAIGPDGTIYGVVGQEPTQFQLFVLDGSTGTLKWSRRFPSLSALAIGRSGEVYLSAGNQFSSIDGSTGSTNWASRFSPAVTRNPAIAADGTLILVAEGTVYAVDGDSGKTKWRKDQDCCWDTPV